MHILLGSMSKMRVLSLISFIFVLSGEAWAVNDPVVMYPLKHTGKDASRCDNGDARLYDVHGRFQSAWPSEDLFFPLGGSKIVGIINNNKNLKFKAMTMMLWFRPARNSPKHSPLVQFAAQGKSVLLLSIKENYFHLSTYSKCDDMTLGMELTQRFAEEDEVSNKRHFVAVTYSYETGNVTLHSVQGLSNGYFGNLEILEPDYIYLGNNMENVTRATNGHEPHSEGAFSGKMRCFILYRRILTNSQMQDAENVCFHLVKDDDQEDWEDLTKEFVCPPKPNDNDSSIICSDNQSKARKSFNATSSSTLTSTYAFAETLKTSLIFDNVSTSLASSTVSKDGFNTSTNKVQQGVNTSTTAFASSVVTKTRTQRFPLIVSLYAHLQTQHSIPLLRTLSATEALLQRAVKVKSATMLSTKHIFSNSGTQQKTTEQTFFVSTQQLSQSIKPSSPLHTPRATQISLKTMSILQSAEKLVTIQEHIIPFSSSSQQNTAVQMFSHLNTQQSYQSISKSPALQTPKATNFVLGSMAIFKSANTLITDSEHISVSSSSQHNTPVQVFSSVVTEQSTRSITQSTPLDKLTTTNIYLERMTTVQSAITLTTNPAHTLLSNLSQQDVSVKMCSASVKIQPTKTSEQQSLPSHPTSTKECSQGGPLGMETGEISDAQITASSQWNNSHAASRGRLQLRENGSKAGGWSAGINDLNQWLQIDLHNKNVTITGVATQGKNGRGHTHLVIAYKLQYSNNGVDFQYYREPGQATDKKFPGNKKKNDVVYNDLNPPIRARYIRFRPVTWKKHIAMRVELYGCQDHDINYSWTDWTTWSACDKPCGRGLRTRSRECVAESKGTNNVECDGENKDVNDCNTHPCQVVPLGVELHLPHETWDDSLLHKNSVMFKDLDARIKKNIRKMYDGNSNLVDSTLNHCRKGSVIVNFTVTFSAVDSDELLQFAENADKYGRIADLVVSSASFTATGVPNKTLRITKIYLTSANSFKVFWASVTDEPLDGYVVAYRAVNEGRWSTTAVDQHTTSLHQTDLLEGMMYRVRVMAFNGSGNGIPGEAKEIKMEEGVPKVAPVLNVEDMISTNSIAISWTALPEEHVMGRILGYHVMYKPVKEAEKLLNKAEKTTITIDSPDVLQAMVTGLKSYTSYTIQVAGFTAKGVGIPSATFAGDTCPCPKVFYTNWAELPPYVTKPVNGRSPLGIIGTFVEEMLSESCGICNGHRKTSLDFRANGKGGTAYKRTMKKVILDVDSKTEISFPVTGAMDDDKFQRYHVFVPVVESPGIAFITFSKTDGTRNKVISTIVKYLPLYLFCLMLAYVAGTVIWALDTSQDMEGFSESFVKGAGEGFWFSFISMTTVGYGDKVPAGVCSRLFAVIWIVTGLVMASILVGVMASSLTFQTIDKDIMLYGTEVTALTDSPAHKLGVRRNALIRPRETLQEAYRTLDDGDVNGLLLDAYVAGSHFLKDIFDQQLRVKEVIKLPKGIGVVLAGEAMKLQDRLRDYIKHNAGMITKMIENSTSPLQNSFPGPDGWAKEKDNYIKDNFIKLASRDMQPEKSEAEEQATELFSVNSLLFHEILMALSKALGVAVLCGLIWELIRKVLGLRKSVHPEKHGNASLMTRRKEMLETVENFHQSFRQIYLDLRYKNTQEIRYFGQERTPRTRSRKNAWI